MDLAERFPPHVLREYALLADGERGAVIGPRGDIGWMCAPRWDSDAVFSTLVGGGGVFAVTPMTPFVWGGYYEPGSLVWRNRFVSNDGLLEVAEALAFPGDPATAVVLRRLHAMDGATEVEVTLRPRARFGAASLRDVHSRDGVFTARTGNLRIRCQGLAGARRRDGALVARLSLAEGDVHDLVLEISEEELGDLPVPDRAWKETRQGWSRSVPDFDGVVAEKDVRHAYTVLRGLTGGSGAMVAAATMSLPERADAGRNYDYRYAWIRDQCYAGQAVAAFGPHKLLDDAVEFVAQRLLDDGPQLKPAYTVSGGPVPEERALDLPGYPGGYDKVGNWVRKQFQLDAFGESLLLFAAAARHDHLDVHHWKAAQAATAAIAQRWKEPDAGIWEIDDEQWTHSKLTCVAGLRALAAHAPATDAAPWLTLADTILATTTRQSLHSSGRWQRSPTDSSVDASLLLPAIRGAVPADDPRTVATLAAVSDDLVEDGYVYRFRQDARALSAAEGAFLLCGFLMVLAEEQQGHSVSAMHYFERNRAACGPPGLYSEEYDVSQRQLRGNLPQAFVHALLLESAVRLR
ncbi:MAG TPA: glycoside hydrolase family 15 protein [Mycobacteriales bacterium]|nr:glycoside hydrolase family 15 protein [Mycobacteriales bacterium]